MEKGYQDSIESFHQSLLADPAISDALKEKMKIINQEWRCDLKDRRKNKRKIKDRRMKNE